MDQKIENDIKKLIQICHSNLKNSKECVNYLINKRGLSTEIIRSYQLGFFPQNVSTLTDFVSEFTLQKLSIINYSGSSMFSDFFYLIFPIFNEYRKAIGIGGRCLLSGQEREVFNIPKYKNSSYKKSRTLFGLEKARSEAFLKQNIFVAEGYFDQIALYSAGLKNSVAICGTAFSKYHFLKLSRYSEKISFILDGDDAGTRAMENIYHEYSNQGTKLRFYHLPPGCKDIDDYFRNGGTAEDFNKDIKSYIPGVNLC